MEGSDSIESTAAIHYKWASLMEAIQDFYEVDKSIDWLLKQDKLRS